MFPSEQSSVSRFFHQNNVSESNPQMSVGSNLDCFGSGIGHFTTELELERNHFAEFGKLDGLYLDVVSPPFQLYDDETMKFVRPEPANNMLIGPEKRSCVIPSASLEMLRRHESKRLRFESSSNITVAPRHSTQVIIELAAEKFIQSQTSNQMLVGLSEEDGKGVQLIQNLLSCAEKVGDKEYELAIKLLNECYDISSRTGTPIERLAFYFIEALYERIQKETGRKDLVLEKHLDILLDEVLKWPSNILIAFHKELPLSQIAKFAGVQAIVDHVEESSNVHVIDLEIRGGIQYIILMQALATRVERPIQKLKVTAVVTKSKTALIEETGKQLMSFAQSLNLIEFSFHIVMVEDMIDLDKNRFELDNDEVVAIYSAYALTTLIGMTDRIQNLMKVVKEINPFVMIVTEIESNCNSPTFFGRFVEALFFNSAFFDSLAVCLKNDEENRREAESRCCSLCIRNILAAEGEERKIRHVSMNIWRSFFASFGLMEIELSGSSLYQAYLVRQRFECGSSCTLDMDGKSLTIGWKGTPLSSVSAWKFQ